ncbi:MAG: hypothetical protein ACFBZ8_03855 [Opitutales bacterium]
MNSTPEELRPRITSQSWLEDMQFVLILAVDPMDKAEKEKNLLGYLSERYQPYLVSSVKLSLLCSYDWIAKNWIYLGEVGLRKENGILNCVLFALHNLVFNEISEENWMKVPDTGPMVIVKMSQEFIDSENKQT